MKLLMFVAAAYIIKVNTSLLPTLWQWKIHYILFQASGVNCISALFSTLPIKVFYSINWLLSLILQSCRKWCYGIYKALSVSMHVCLAIWLHGCLASCLSVGLAVCLLGDLSGPCVGICWSPVRHLSGCLSVHLSDHLSGHLLGICQGISWGVCCGNCWGVCWDIPWCICCYICQGICMARCLLSHLVGHLSI